MTRDPPREPSGLLLSSRECPYRFSWCFNEALDNPRYGLQPATHIQAMIGLRIRDEDNVGPASRFRHRVEGRFVHAGSGTTSHLSTVSHDVHQAIGGRPWLEAIRQVDKGPFPDEGKHCISSGDRANS